MLVTGIDVGLLGLEPRLFWTKTRRVASYTMGHYRNSGCKFKRNFLLCKLILKNITTFLYVLKKLTLKLPDILNFATLQKI